MSFSFRNQLSSFRHAWNGLIILIREEHNARIHFALALIVIVLGVFFRISSLEWIAVTLTIGLVITAEIINSAIETLSNFVSPGRNESIKKAKDLSAAAVLVSSITAVIVGLIVFLPRVVELIKSL